MTNPENVNVIKYQTMSCKVLPIHAVKAYGKVEEQLHIFLSLDLDRGKQYASHSGVFTPWESSPQYLLNRSLDSHRAGLDSLAKGKVSSLPEIKPQLLSVV